MICFMIFFYIQLNSGMVNRLAFWISAIMILNLNSCLEVLGLREGGWVLGLPYVSQNNSFLPNLFMNQNWGGTKSINSHIYVVAV